MGYRAHAAVTILATIGAVLGGCAAALFVGVQLLARGMAWPLPLLLVLCTSAGFFIPTWLMQRVPVRCAKCGADAWLKLVAWKFKDSFIPSPVYAYRCGTCRWSTYRWDHAR